MAVVDGYGRTAAGVAGEGDVTNEAFVQPLLALLPSGPAWNREDPTLRTLVRSIGVELSRIQIRGDKLVYRELNPDTTHETVADWEESYGLPDCAKPVSLAARRAAIKAKLLAQTGHDQSFDYWKSLLEDLGYLLYWHNAGKPVMTCIDECTDELTDEQWLYLWELAVVHGIDDALLACVVAHNAQLHTYPLIHFLWEPIVVPEPANLYGVAATDDGFVVAIGAGAAILRSGADYDKTDGSGWTLGTADPGNVEDLFAVAAIGTVLVACGVPSTNFYRSTDHGATWLSTADSTEEMYAITRGIGEGVAVAAGENGTCWRTFNSGASWSAGTTITGNPNILGLTRCGNGVDYVAVIAVGANGHIYRTPNSGTTWIDAYTAAAALRGVAGWEMVVVAVGSSGTIVRSVDGGQTWASVVSPTTATLRAVVGSPANRWTAVGDGGVIVQSLDAGMTWTVQVSPTTEHLRAVARHDPSGRAVIVGANTTIIVE